MSGGLSGSLSRSYCISRCISGCISYCISRCVSRCVSGRTGNSNFDWVKSDKQYPNPISGKMEDTFQMVDKNPEDHWYDVNGHLEHEKRVQEGLELFGKYFRNLWD